MNIVEPINSSRSYTAFHSDNKTVVVVPNESRLISFLGQEINPKIAHLDVSVWPYVGLTDQDAEKFPRSTITIYRLAIQKLVNSLYLFECANIETSMTAGRTIQSSGEIHFSLTIGPSPHEVYGAIDCFVYPINGESVINLLSVKREQQRKGYGSILLETALLINSLYGIRYCELNSSDQGLPLYISHGFFNGNVYKSLEELEKDNLNSDNLTADETLDPSLLTLDLKNGTRESIQALNGSVAKHLKLKLDVQKIAHQAFSKMSDISINFQNISFLSEIRFIHSIPLILEEVAITHTIGLDILSKGERIQRLQQEKFDSLSQSLLNWTDPDRLPPNFQKILQEATHLKDAIKNLIVMYPKFYINKQSFQLLEKRRCLLEKFECKIIHLNIQQPLIHSQTP